MISFDVFDTLITRSSAEPTGIFTIMQEILQKKNEYYGISSEFAASFYFQRVGAEELARRKWCVNGIEDITLCQIYDAMVYGGALSKESADKIMELELQIEFDNILPIKENIALVKEYLQMGEKVVLISDMYLSTEQIRKLLVKVDEIFADIMIYVSNEYKLTKGSGRLYQEIAKLEDVSFSDWKHYGDNEVADVERPKTLGMQAVKIEKKELLEHEKMLLSQYEMDAYVQSVTGISSYLKAENNYRKVGQAYGGPIIYSYVNWLIDSCVKQGINRLYFVARDGWILKKAADCILAQRGISIQTYYIYGSRKAWRLAAVSKDNADYSNILLNSGKGIWSSAKELEDLLQISTDDLAELFPYKWKMLLNSEPKYFSRYAYELFSYIAESDKIGECLYKKGKESRELAVSYFKENVDLSDDKFAFVELSGTGYTQVCLAKILQDIKPCKLKSFFLQMAGMWDEENAEFQVFHPNIIPYHYIVEMLCRAPHGQTEGYKKQNGKAVPILADMETGWKDGEGYSEYVEGVLEFVETFAPIHGMNGSCDNGKVVNSYLQYVNENTNSIVHDFLMKMPFSTCGVQEGQIYAPPLTKEQLKMRFLYGEMPLDYKGASIDFALDHMSGKDAKLRASYSRLSKTAYGKWCIRRYHNKKYGLQGRQRYFYPKNLLCGNVILYGAGKVGKDYYKQMHKDKNCRLVAWTDTNYESMEKSLKQKLISPDKVAEVSYDVIFIAIASKITYEKIKDSLIKRGISEDKIMWLAPLVRK